jgi:SAM-dependent methyltransferase
VLGRLKAAYLGRHHAMARGASDHPIGHARRMLGAVVEERGDKGVLCDVGAGFEASFLADLWRGRRIALDVVFAPGLDVVADGCALPLQSASVDAITLIEVLEHIANPLRLLCESGRALRHGGHLCLTAPQYHITHNHPNDFYRFTRQGLEYLCGEAGLTIVDVRATGGPLLVLFHAVELNLPPRARLVFVGLTYRLFDWLDGRVSDHGNRPGSNDAKGWALLARKP